MRRVLALLAGGVVIGALVLWQVVEIAFWIALAIALVGVAVPFAVYLALRSALRTSRRVDRRHPGHAVGSD